MGLWNILVSIFATLRSLMIKTISKAVITFRKLVPQPRMAVSTARDRVTAKELKEMIEKDPRPVDWVVLDVREPWEINEVDLPAKNKVNQPVPKVNIPIKTFLGMDKPEIDTQLPQNKRILCLCAAGVRSAKAQAHLLKNGYNALNIELGIYEFIKAV
eukprot:TRINITY_DN9806_c0_g1_i2.p1 TRINITY_DN9806_c0_g1~~TRINITY_DN9806_c0_g1_i2.p1  ORF type:complete len:158 (+),score=32.22 TRINITY_DN9806_c0_g1_i2:134-607(+)